MRRPWARMFSLPAKHWAMLSITISLASVLRAVSRMVWKSGISCSGARRPENGVLPWFLDHQAARSIVHVGHRVRGVADQVQDDLLELHTIADDGREVVGEIRLK